MAVSIPTVVYDLPRFAGIVATTATAVILSTAIYRLFFHPLKAYPGPISTRLTRLTWFYHQIKGDQHKWVTDLHKKYGEVVRIAPDELVFSHPNVWKSIYSYRPGGELPKAQAIYRPHEAVMEHFQNTSSKEYHATIRKRLFGGFSDRAMREQEPIIGKYVDLFIQRLQVKCDNGRQALDIKDWLNFCTFDVIGDLAFGESFGCLEGSAYHEWVSASFSHIREVIVFNSLGLMGLKTLLGMLLNYGMAKGQDTSFSYANEKVKKRMTLEAERPDLIEGLVKRDPTDPEKVDLPLDKISKNAMVLVIAGSETTATLLSGAVYLLLTNPHCMEKLKEEIRTHFKSLDEITLMSVNNDLPYMLACLKESLRRYPPAATSLLRQIPRGGAEVLGRSIPEGTLVSGHHFAVYHDEKLWKNPTKFAPERWLGDSEYENDKREALEPFSTGPANCIGKNLAYTEMRLILAKLVYAFEIKMGPGSDSWMDQRTFGVWEKPALNVYLTPVAH